MNENHDPKTGEFSSGGGGGGSRARNLSSNQRLAMGITDNRDAPAQAPRAPNKDTTPRDVRNRLAQGVTDNRDLHASMDKNTVAAHEHTKVAKVREIGTKGRTNMAAMSRKKQDSFNRFAHWK